MKKKLSAFLSLLVLASMVLTACTPAAPQPTTAPVTQPTAAQAAEATKAPAAEPTQAPTDAPAAPAAAEPVELRIAWWGSQARHDRTIKVIEMFMAKNPNIKITYEFAPWADYWTKMNTQAAGGGLPDIMQQDYQMIKEWTGKNLLMPIDQYVTDGTLNLKDIAEASLAGGKMEGKLYAVNLGNNTLCFLVDEDGLKKAGLELPSDQWTWADFETLATAMKEKGGFQYGSNDTLNNVEMWKSLHLANGEWGWAADGTRLGYAEDAAYIDFLDMSLRMQNAGVLPTQSDIAAMPTALESGYFPTGKSGMWWGWTNMIVAVWNAAGEQKNFKALPLPRPVGATSSENYIKPSMFWSVAATSKHPKEAAMFIDYFTNSIEANEVLLAERGIPVSSVVREGLKPKLGRAQLAGFELLSRIEKDVAKLPPPDPAGSADVVNNVFNTTIEQVMYGKLDPKLAMEQIRKDADAILAEKNKK